MMLADLEKAKYRKVWEHEQYRRSSPGEALVDNAIESLGIKPGDSVIDFGCGTGRAAKKFMDYGVNVTGVDIADNCLDGNVNINFVLACLWSPECDLRADYGFCADVMEHIPESRVDRSLQTIHESTDAVFFQIATRHDVMGRLIGEPLHMTVKDEDWWYTKLNEFWHSVHITPKKSEFLAVCR